MNFILTCVQCKHPLSGCLCVPDAFQCRQCGVFCPFSESRVRKLDDTGHWTYGKRSYLCKRCRTSARARKDYKQTLHRAAANESAQRRIKKEHPLYPWARLAHKAAWSLFSRQVTQNTSDEDSARIRYDHTLGAYLRAYAEKLDTIIDRREDYAKEGRLAYPDGLKPTLALVKERLPTSARHLLFEEAVRCGLKRQRKEWAVINKKYR